MRQHAGAAGAVGNACNRSGGLAELVADFDGYGRAVRRRRTGNPRNWRRIQFSAVQSGLRADDDAAGIRLQADDKARVAAAGQPQPPPLPDGKILDAVMLTQDISGGVHNVAGGVIGALPQEFPVVAGGDKADVLAVGLAGVGQPGGGGQLADFVFRIVADGHQGSGQLLLAHPEQHIGLVFVGVHAPPQRPADGVGVAIAIPVPGGNDAGVVAGSDILRLHGAGALRQKAELDLVVAGDAGMGGAPGFVLAPEIVNDESAELPLHIEDIMRHAQNAADGAGILNIVQRAAAPIGGGQVGLVNIVKFHRNADDRAALPMQQQGSDRRIHAAAHGDDDARRIGIAGVGIHSLIVAGNGPIVKRDAAGVGGGQQIPQDLEQEPGIPQSDFGIPAVQVDFVKIAVQTLGGGHQTPDGRRIRRFVGDLANRRQEGLMAVIHPAAMSSHGLG